MDDVFRWIEVSDLSVWLRSTPSVFAFPAVLVVHALGMALFAGSSIAISLRMLGVAPGVPLAAMSRFMPVLWIGLALAAASGALLVVAYPTKALTNPVFFLKLTCLALAATCAVRANSTVMRASTLAPGRARLLALLLLVFVVGTITGGRYLAYTYSRLTVDFARMI